ncbi:MAG: hypothetical protein ABI409_02230 [Ramlibacter sp.]
MLALMRGCLIGLEHNRALKQGGAIVVTVVAILLGPTAHAQYRCTQPGGTVSYQQTPCAADSKGNGSS